jgi:aminoglycoside 3-N-acetyltransferase
VITPADLRASLQHLGLARGDVLLVHSSLRALGGVEGGADAVADTFLDLVGPEGLLVVPTHTWDTVNDRQPVWHETYTPSHTGILTNVVRKRPGAIRSLHPTHSVAALGNRAAEFCAGHENDGSPCSPTSPYGRLLDWGGKIVLLGVDLTRCTYFHCLEEIAGLGAIWSLTDPSPRVLLRSDGQVIHVVSRGHKDYKSDHYGRAEADLTAAGAVATVPLGPSRVLVVDARASAAFLLPRFRENPRYFW